MSSCEAPELPMAGPSSWNSESLENEPVLCLRRTGATGAETFPVKLAELFVACSAGEAVARSRGERGVVASIGRWSGVTTMLTQVSSALVSCAGARSESGAEVAWVQHFRVASRLGMQTWGECWVGGGGVE